MHSSNSFKDSFCFLSTWNKVEILIWHWYSFWLSGLLLESFTEFVLREWLLFCSDFCPHWISVLIAVLVFTHTFWDSPAESQPHSALIPGHLVLLMLLVSKAHSEPVLPKTLPIGQESAACYSLGTIHQSKFIFPLMLLFRIKTNLYQISCNESIPFYY